MRLSIACEKRKDELKNFLSKYGCQKATKKGKPSKIRCLYRQKEAKKATKIEEIPKIRCLSRLVKREKATKKGKPSKIRCFYRRQEAKKATKIEEIPKIRCLSRLVKREKATKSEKIPEIRCPTHAFPKKARSQKGNNPKKAPNNKAAAPWCGCPILYSLSNYC